ncbi:MAG: queuosine precursor transporter [Desulfopila sp.]
MNELLWFAMLIANFLLILFLYRFAGRTGLFLWVPIATIVANIQVVKMVNLFGVEATLGNIVYASSFLVTDILSENYGKADAKKAIYCGFFSMISFVLLMNMALWFTPSAHDFAQQSMVTLFGLMPRIALASFVAYGVSQFHDIVAFEFWRRHFPQDRYLWLRNNLSTMVSQALDTVVFTTIAFTGTYPFAVLVEICLSAYLLKWLVALLDTPFVYLARWCKHRGLVRELF